jgi:hypothetical protein
MDKKSLFGVMLCVAFWAGVVYAQDSTDSGNTGRSQGMYSGQPPAPPQEAITACSDKAEGAACEANTPNGTEEGVCAYTPDKKYFACRPKNMPSGGPGGGGPGGNSNGGSSAT